MPLTYLLKLYARLVACVLVLALVCVLLFQGLNSVRQQMWLEQHSSALMHWLAAANNPASHYPWLVAAYNFQLGPAAQLAGSGVIQERLSFGQVVAQATSTGQRLRVARADGRVLSLTLANPFADISRASALMVRQHLNNAPASRRDATLQSLSAALNLGAPAITDPGQLPPADVLQQVARDGLVLFTPNNSRRPRVALQLADGELLVLIPPAPFSRWSPVVWAPLGALVALVLALALWWLAHTWNNRLLRLESAAQHIARGELATRLEPGGSVLQQRLAAAFNGMAEHIQRLVQVQHDMIHAVSHELRTPVARIRFGVQMLADAVPDAALDARAKSSAPSLLQDIDSDIQELDDLIDEILTYARLEQSELRFNLQPASVPELLRQVLSQQQLLHPGLAMELELDQPDESVMVGIEPRYLHRALQNLVGNAARYARSKVQVRFQLGAEHCRIDVEDDGPGIPKADWERVFTAFARLDDSRTRTSGGYGLGLSIVQRILYWHGGQAFVGASDTLGGARFSLVWPRVQTQSGGLHPLESAPHPPG